MIIPPFLKRAFQCSRENADSLFNAYSACALKVLWPIFSLFWPFPEF